MFLPTETPSFSGTAIWKFTSDHNTKTSTTYLCFKLYSDTAEANLVHVTTGTRKVDCVWNVMAHAQKPDFVFGRNGRVHLNRQGRQFSRLLAAEVCASAVVMLDTPCCEVVWRVLATHYIRQFPLHFPPRVSTCAITFQLDSTICHCLPTSDG